MTSTVSQQPHQHCSSHVSPFCFLFAKRLFIAFFLNPYNPSVNISGVMCLIRMDKDHHPVIFSAGPTEGIEQHRYNKADEVTKTQSPRQWVNVTSKGWWACIAKSHCKGRLSLYAVLIIADEFINYLTLKLLCVWNSPSVTSHGRGFIQPGP